MGGKFPSVRVSVRPQKVSSISMKFGIQVVLDERWKKLGRLPNFGSRRNTVGGKFPYVHLSGADKWPRILKLGGNV